MFDGVLWTKITSPYCTVLLAFVPWDCFYFPSLLFFVRLFQRIKLLYGIPLNYPVQEWASGFLHYAYSFVSGINSLSRRTSASLLMKPAQTTTKVAWESWNEALLQKTEKLRGWRNKNSVDWISVEIISN